MGFYNHGSIHSDVCFFAKSLGAEEGQGRNLYQILPGGCRMSLFRTARVFESLNTMVIGVDWFQDVSNLFI